MLIFDFLFYKICKFYKRNKSSSPGVGAVCIISSLQSFNVISIVMLLDLIFAFKNISTSFFVAPVLLFMVINYIKYVYRESPSYENLKLKFDNEFEQLNLIKMWSAVYSIFTIVFLIVLLVYHIRR